MEENNKQFAVIGLGRTARAAAAYVMHRGGRVMMWGRSREERGLLRQQGLNVTGLCGGNYFPEIRESIEETLKDADVILVLTLAAGHKPIAERMKNRLGRRQTILIFNGNWGAYEFAQALGEEAEEKEVRIAETGSMLFLADYEKGNCHIKSIKEKIGVAAVKPEETADLCRELRPVFPQLVPEENVISTSLNSSNPVLHVTLALFNFTRMENGEDYSFYGDGATSMTLRAAELVDQERRRVARALGLTPKSCLEIINGFWPCKRDTLYDAIKRNEAYLSGKGPVMVNHRYLEEDLPFGILPIRALGRLCGVETPCIDALTEAYERLLQIDNKGKGPVFDAGKLEQIIGRSLN